MVPRSPRASPKAISSSDISPTLPKVVSPKNVSKVVSPKAVVSPKKSIPDLTKALSKLKMEKGPRYPLYVSLNLTKEDMKVVVETVKDRLRNSTPLEYKQVNEEGHVTLAYSKDFKDLSEYKEFVDKHFRGEHEEKKEYTIEVGGYGWDSDCVAALVYTGASVYPKAKIPHITLMLNAKPPVYSNELLERLTRKDYVQKDNEDLVIFDKPLVLKTTLTFNGWLKEKANKVVE